MTQFKPTPLDGRPGRADTPWCELHDLAQSECAHCRGDVEPTHWPETPAGTMPPATPRAHRPVRPRPVPTEVHSPDPMVRIRRDLTAIRDMLPALPARGIDLGDHPAMPGGDATAHTRCANQEAWEHREQTTEHHRLTHDPDGRPRVYAVADDEDPEDAWTATQTLAWWAEHWARMVNADPPTPELATITAWLTRRDLLAWVATNEPDLDQAADDIHVARTTLENLTRAGERNTRSRVTCDRCPHPKRLIQVHGRAGQSDTWKAPCCGTRYDEDDKNRALARQLRTTGAARWVERGEAIAAILVQGWTRRDVDRMLATGVATKTEGRTRYVWWPDLWHAHRQATTDRDLKRQAAAERQAQRHACTNQHGPDCWTRGRCTA